MNEKVVPVYGTVLVKDDDKEQVVKPTKRESGLPAPLFLGTLFLTLIVGSYYLIPLITVIPTSFLSIEQRAHRILTENPLIDGHNDLLIFLRFLNGNHVYSQDFKQKFEQGGLEYHVDLPRIKQGKMGGAFWSAFVPCPPDAWNFSDATYEPYVRQTLEQIDLYHRLSTEYPRYFTPNDNHAAAITAFRNHQLISPLAIEGLHQIGNSLSTLRLYHRLGVRYATLTWNCHNRFADAAIVPDPDTGTLTAKRPKWHGLSPPGRTLVREMNRLGMLVDLSHVSPDTMRAVLADPSPRSSPSPSSSSSREEDDDAATGGSLAPPIFSHSSAHALCPHPRNVPDDVLQRVRARGALVMINFAPDFVACRPGPETPATGIPETVQEEATLAQVVRHIRHIGELVGYDHVGIGSDFDGIQTVPEGLEDVSKFPDLVAEMLRQGVSDADAAKVVGRNLLRVWKEVDRVAEELQKSLKPVEDDLPGLNEAFGYKREL
ncbi:MAG: hypothetical protein M1821_006407 [Bathelium mastoideum]|nr:MAG: hypothetical protein M1821_006407 [Bathelium mastoideum]